MASFFTIPGVGTNAPSVVPIATGSRTALPTATGTRAPANKPPAKDNRTLILAVVIASAGVISIALIAFLIYRMKKKAFRNQAPPQRTNRNSLEEPYGHDRLKRQQSERIPIVVEGPDKDEESGTHKRNGSQPVQPNHPAARITPFGSPGGETPRFFHTPGANMRLASRRDDGVWEFGDPRSWTPNTPSGVTELPELDAPSGSRGSSRVPSPSPFPPSSLGSPSPFSPPASSVGGSGSNVSSNVISNPSGLPPYSPSPFSPPLLSPSPSSPALSSSHSSSHHQSHSYSHSPSHSKSPSYTPTHVHSHSDTLARIRHQSSRYPKWGPGASSRPGGASSGSRTANPGANMKSGRRSRTVTPNPATKLNPDPEPDPDDFDVEDAYGGYSDSEVGGPPSAWQGHAHNASSSSVASMRSAPVAGSKMGSDVSSSSSHSHSHSHSRTRTNQGSGSGLGGPRNRSRGRTTATSAGSRTPTTPNYSQSPKSNYHGLPPTPGYSSVGARTPTSPDYNNYGNVRTPTTPYTSTPFSPIPSTPFSPSPGTPLIPRRLDDVKKESETSKSRFSFN